MTLMSLYLIFFFLVGVTLHGMFGKDFIQKDSSEKSYLTFSLLTFLKCSLAMSVSKKNTVKNMSLCLFKR